MKTGPEELRLMLRPLQGTDGGGLIAELFIITIAPGGGGGSAAATGAHLALLT